MDTLEYIDTVESDVTILDVEAIPTVPSAVASITVDGWNQRRAGLQRVDMPNSVIEVRRT